VEGAKPGEGVYSHSSTSCGMWISLLLECVPPKLVDAFLLDIPFFFICKQNQKEMRYIKAKYEV
jgi:hypothetical protein